MKVGARKSHESQSPTAARRHESVRNDQNEQIDITDNGQNQETGEQTGSEQRELTGIQQVQIPALTGSLQKSKIPTPKELKNVDNITIVRAFVQSIQSLMR